METEIHYRVQRYNQTNPTCNQLLLILHLFQYFHPVSPRNQLFRFPWQISEWISDPNFSTAHLVLHKLKTFILFVFGAIAPSWSGPPHSRGFLDYTQRRTTFSRTHLDEWSTRRRDLYLKTHNSHNRQTCMPPVRFEPTISAGERPQTYALDRAATETGENLNITQFK